MLIRLLIYESMSLVNCTLSRSWSMFHFEKVTFVYPEVWISLCVSAEVPGWLVIVSFGFASQRTNNCDGSFSNSTRVCKSVTELVHAELDRGCRWWCDVWLKLQYFNLLISIIIDWFLSHSAPNGACLKPLFVLTEWIEFSTSELTRNNNWMVSSFTIILPREWIAHRIYIWE